MTLAARVQGYLEARAAREAERQAARLERDTFILARFPLLNARLAELAREAVGLHTRLSVTEVPMVETVVGRTFATLPKNALRIAAALGAATQAVTFTPRLEFRGPDQFGAVGCSLDFVYRPRRSRQNELARRLLDPGMHMTGTASAHLMLGTLEVSPSLLESALVAFLLK